MGRVEGSSGSDGKLGSNDSAELCWSEEIFVVSKGRHKVIEGGCTHELFGCSGSRDHDVEVNLVFTNCDGFGGAKAERSG